MARKKGTVPTKPRLKRYVSLAKSDMERRIFEEKICADIEVRPIDVWRSFTESVFDMYPLVPKHFKLPAAQEAKKFMVILKEPKPVNKVKEAIEDALRKI
ncbi:MAG: hypothetical protein ACTSX6_10505 [Candidatus Heimdallarchaeaceae archaeon]